MMTRKDYVEVANILKAFEDNDELPTSFLIDSFIELFKKDNPRFDSKRFTDAVIG